MPWNGFLPLPLWACVVVTLAMTHVTVAATTIYLHRNQAHRALTLHPLVSHFFRFWLWLTTGTVTREWVAVHRKHHAKCETDDDPHSPQRKGLPSVLFGGALLYKKEASKPDTLDVYGRGTPDDWLERHLYARHSWLGIVLMLCIDVLLFGFLAGPVIFGVQMIWIPFWAAGVINGVGHFWGYRNFETADASRNIVPVGLVMGGEELHNNHHAYRQSARFSNKWWEFDVGWLYIRLLESMRLARVLRKAPKTEFRAVKDIVDSDTVSAVIRNRFHVLKLYGSRVVRPVLRAEFENANTYARQQLRRLARLLTREDLQWRARDFDALHEALQRSRTLEVVHEFREQLKSLLQPSVGEASRLHRLQAWCARAEATGIEALREFAESLRGYSVRPA